MEPNHDMLGDVYRITKENNHMLHAMRRRALVGGLIKFIIWAVLILGPVWFYMTYLNASVQKVLDTFTQIQSTGAKAEAQLRAFQQSISELQAKIPGLPTAAPSPTTTQ